MYEVFVNESKTKRCSDIRKATANDTYSGMTELFDYA